MSSCFISDFFTSVLIFMHFGAFPRLSYLVSFEFKAVPRSVPSFSWMKNVLLLGLHKICHFLRTMIISTFLLVTREEDNFPDNTYLHKLNIQWIIYELFIQLNVSSVLNIILRQYMFVCDSLFLFQGSVWATDCFVEICAGATVFKGYGLQYARSE